MNLLIDFETYSELDLSVVGSYKYAKHVSTKPLLCGYKILGTDSEPKVWELGEPLPECFFEATTITAHNAVFDYLVWSSTIGFPHTNLSMWNDSMALCGKYAYPLSLDKAAKALGVRQKNAEGKRLINMFSKPTGKNKYTHPTEWSAFKRYCGDDISTMEAIINMLPRTTLNKRDQKLWQITQEINFRGVPVEPSEAEAIYRYVEMYKETHAERLPELTDGKVTKATQVKRIKDWCADQGYPMADGLGALLIEEVLDDGFHNPPNRTVAEVLAIRLEMGSSSSAKFKKVVELEHNGRVHMNLMQFAATTGRYAGRGFQLHNLAKLTAKNPGELIQKFKDIDEIDNPPKAAKSLVRAMIKAPEGMQLTVADWVGIETHLLFWLVNDVEALDVLRNRGDLYVHMAAAVYGVPIDQVDRDTMRPLGKALILGCGYGMGYKRFQQAAKTFGLNLDLTESNRAVKAYRAKYGLVRKGWYSLMSAAKQAINFPGREIPMLRCVFQMKGTSLWLTLPSGRKLHYPMARVSSDGISYMGVNSTTHQWGERRLIPGQIMENIIQAAAADVLNFGLVNVDEELPSHQLIGHVHDEAITLTRKSSYAPLESLITIMCQTPDWAEGLPLFADGYNSERFKK